MNFDTILRNGRIAGAEHELVDIGVRDGRIAAIGPNLGASDVARDVPLDGRLLVPGFVETYIHLDVLHLRSARAAPAP